MFMNFSLAHLSDTHIGYQAYKVLSNSGENQRSVDFARAFVLNIDSIIEQDPPLVIHSGDVADKTIIPIRLMLFIRNEFKRLAGMRANGTRRQVIIVAGNHELPRDRKEASLLELLKDIPGVHVSTTKYDKFTFDDFLDADPVLSGTVVHALPHDILKSVDFNHVKPIDGMRNILSSHGVAGGSDLFTRSLGREFPIPADVLLRKWDYVALGHWHKQGPVSLYGSISKIDKAQSNVLPVSRIWYAGSTENSGFGDVLDGGENRGWLKVSFDGDVFDVKPVNVQVRKMFRLPTVDGTGLKPDEIKDLLIANLKSKDISGGVIGQIVTGVDREVWSLVDLASVRNHASNALHYDVACKSSKIFNRESILYNGGGSNLIKIIDDACSELLTDINEKNDVFELIKSTLNSSGSLPINDDEKRLNSNDLTYEVGMVTKYAKEVV